jgi:flavin reductase (DIM6/NTAB) family NADH-FMN oxidoreductase RutF
VDSTSAATQALDAITARLDSPLLVVTAASGEHRGGCVVGFQTQCGLQPVRFALWLSKANVTYRIALFASHLAAHVLDRFDHDLVELFGGETGDEVDKLDRCAWTPGPAGVPLLERCPNRIVLRKTAMFDDGTDHVCVVGEPVDASFAESLTPLRLSDADDVEPGHAAEDRDMPRDLTR